MRTALSTALRFPGSEEPQNSEESCAGPSSQDWDRFYEENWSWIFRLIERLGDAGIDPEDAAQDVFMIILKKLPGFEGRSSLKTWIYRITLNVISEHRKRAQRSARLKRALSMLGIDRSPPPARRLEAQSELAQLQAVLFGMSPKRRQIFVLCEIEALSHEEVSEVLNIPRGTVRSRLHHARHDFFTRLKRCAS